MKLFGHPVHMMFVHFPAALLPMELVCYSIYYFNHDTSFAMTSFYAMAGGVSIGWLSVITGMLDLGKISPDKSEAQTRVFVHGVLQTSVLIAYSVFLYTAWKRYPAAEEPATLLLTGKVILIMIMLAGNYLGGNLILRYKIGIDN